MMSRAAPTPVVDEKAIYAFFESGDLIALSHSGETLWKTSLASETNELKTTTVLDAHQHRHRIVSSY